MDISRLSLFRNDPEAAAEVLEAAHKGDMDAQFAAGLVYAEGRGVPQDAVQSYYWLTRAVEQGDRDAEKLRIYVAAGMTGQEFDEARRLVRLAPRPQPANANAVRH